MPAAPFGPDAGTGNVVGGVVPTKTLGLPDEYAFDEWGRRFTYIVDKRATQFGACATLQNYPLNDGKGAIAIRDGEGVVIDHVMAMYLSHGPDGHGAFPMQGSSVANRINAGVIDADSLTNAGVNSSFTYSTSNFTNNKVMNEPTSSYDDITYYANYQHNKCCYGAACLALTDGFRIDGATNNGALFWWTAHGDFDGDGIVDLVTLAGGVAYNIKIYVMFGRSGGFTDNVSVSTLDGTTGFRVDTDVVGQPSVGDIDGDGIDDLVIGQGYERVHVLYGSPALKGGPASYNGQSLTGCKGHQFYKAPAYFGRSTTVGDVNGDGIDDILMTYNQWGGADRVYIVFGQTGTKNCPNTGPIPSNASDVTVLNSTTNPKGAVITSPVNNNNFGVNGSLWTADVNGDGIKDVIIGDSDYNSYKGRLYIVFGQATWPNSTAAGSLTTNAAPYGVIINNNTSNNGFPYGMAVGDVNGDGKDDIMTHFGLLIYGKSTAEWQALGTGPFNITTLVSNGSASWFSGSLFYGWTDIADVNKDGIKDLLMGDSSGGTNGYTYVIFGKPGLTGFNVSNASNWDGVKGVRFACPASAGGTCGQNPAAADLNADGILDVVIGAGDGSTSGSNKRGWGYVYYGRTSGWPGNYDLSTIY